MREKSQKMTLDAVRKMRPEIEGEVPTPKSPHHKRMSIEDVRVKAGMAKAPPAPKGKPLPAPEPEAPKAKGKAAPPPPSKKGK